MSTDPSCLASVYFKFCRRGAVRGIVVPNRQLEEDRPQRKGYLGIQVVLDVRPALPRDAPKVPQRIADLTTKELDELFVEQLGVDLPYPEGRTSALAAGYSIPEESVVVPRRRRRGDCEAAMRARSWEADCCATRSACAAASRPGGALKDAVAPPQRWNCSSH